MEPVASASPPAPKVSSWDLVLAFLSVYLLIALFAEMVFDLNPEVRLGLNYTDNALCLLFLGDFFYKLFTAPSRWVYLRWGWIDFISSIPSVDLFRWGRFFRVFRILRAIRSARHLVNVVRKSQAQSLLLTVLLGCFLVVDIGAMMVLHLEKDVPGATVTSVQDAFWWALVTITTVGYGDHFPITSGGRMVAAVLMLTGIGLFGTLTAFLSSKLLKKSSEQEGEIREVLSRLESIQQRLESMEARLEARGEKLPD